MRPKSFGRLLSLICFVTLWEGHVAWAQRSYPQSLTGLRNSETLSFTLTSLESGTCEDWCGEADLYFELSLHYVSSTYRSSFTDSEGRPLTGLLIDKAVMGKTPLIQLKSGESLTQSEIHGPSVELKLLGQEVNHGTWLSKNRQHGTALRVGLELRESDSLLDYFQWEEDLRLAQLVIDLPELVQKVRQQNGQLELVIKDEHSRSVPSSWFYRWQGNPQASSIASTKAQAKILVKLSTSR